jgi:hypothetical protein
MKVFIALSVSVFLLSFAGILRADAPDLEAGVYIHDGTDPLDLTGHTAPAVTDWNEDGRKDLVVGNIKGNIWLFLNQGTDLNPVFDGGSRIQSNGKVIITAFS